jgi:hypothetical protein
MSSVSKQLLRPKRKRDRYDEKPSRKGGPRFHLSSALSAGRLLRGANRRPRISIQLWLTALFLLVTAFAGITAYSIVYPRLEYTLQQLAEAGIEQVGQQFEDQLRRDPQLT